MDVKFGVDEGTFGPLLHAKFHALPSVQRDAPAGRKTSKSASE